MDYLQFETLDESKRRAPVYVLTGPELFFKDQAVREIRRLHLSVPGEEEHGYVEFDGRRAPGGELDPRLVLDEIRTRSLFSGAKVVAVREADSFLEKHGEPLAAYCRNPSPGGALVLETGRFDKRRKFAKALKAGGGLVVECSRLYDRPPPWKRGLPIYESDLVAWVLRRFRKQGKTISKPTAFYLTEYTGNNLFHVQGALDKLVLYLGEREEVTEEDVGEVLGITRQESLFRFLDALGEKDLRAALESADAIFSSGLRFDEGHPITNEPTVFSILLGRVHRKLKTIREARVFLRGGGRPEELADRLGIKRFLMDRFLAELKAFQGVDLDAAREALLQADLESKSVARSPRRIMEELLVRILAS
jgi:DNA polymerase-3 subunit delta